MANSIGDMDLRSMTMPTRLSNLCENHGITTLAELAACNENEMAVWANCGRKSINEAKGLLASYGMALTKSPLSAPQRDMKWHGKRGCSVWLTLEQLQAIERGEQIEWGDKLTRAIKHATEGM